MENEDSHLFMFLAVIDSNARYLAIAYRSGTPHVERVERLIEALCEALLSNNVRRQYECVIKLDQYLKSLNVRYKRLLFKQSEPTTAGCRNS
jgi:hypothetical protein